MIGHNGGEQQGGNWIAISRDMRDHPIVGFGQPVKPADPKRGSYSRAEAWMDLIAEARWAPGQINNKGKIVELARGALMAARSWLARRWNWTENTVRGFLDRLEREMMIRRNHHHSSPKERRHYANVLTIENYDVFQTASELLKLIPAKRTTNQPPINHQSTTIEPPESNKGTREQINKQQTAIAAPVSTCVSQEEVEGLNGATVTIQNKVARWINPYQPDYRTARGWLTTSVQTYGSDALKEAFAIMETKMASGDIVAAPLKLFAKIAQEKRRELDQRQRAPKPKATHGDYSLSGNYVGKLL